MRFEMDRAIGRCGTWVGSLALPLAMLLLAAPAGARLVLGPLQRIAPSTASQMGWDSVPSANGSAVLFGEHTTRSYGYRLPMYLWRAGATGRQVVGHGEPVAISNDARTIAFVCGRNVLCIKRVGARSVRRITGPCGSLEQSFVSGNMRVLLVACGYGPAEGSTLVAIGSRSVRTTRLSTRLSPAGLSEDGTTAILEHAGNGGSELYLYRGGRISHIKRIRAGFMGMSHNGRFVAEGVSDAAVHMPPTPIAILDLQMRVATCSGPTFAV
jgi:hypothetical protein